MEFFRSALLDGTGVDWQEPRVNLLAADLSGLPPIAVFYGTDELLAGEAGLCRTIYTTQPVDQPGHALHDVNSA